MTKEISRKMRGIAGLMLFLGLLSGAPASAAERGANPPGPWIVSEGRPAP